MSWKLCRSGRLLSAVVGRGGRPTSSSAIVSKQNDHGDDDDDGDKRSPKKAMHVFKRINWENVNLFGPILRRRVSTEWSDGAPAPPATVRRKVTVRLVENGFRSIDGPAISHCTSTHQTLITVNRGDGRGKDNLITTCIASLSPRPLSGRLQVPRAKLTVVDSDSSRSALSSPAPPPSVDQRSPSIDEMVRTYPLSGDHNGGCAIVGATDDWLSRHWFPDRTKPDTWPSVTAILQATMSAESLAFLEAWKKRMIDKLGVQGFAQFKREMFSVGTEFHRCIEDYLSGVKGLADVPVDDGSALAGHWRSLCAILPQVADAKLLETRIHHPQLCYTGVIDCVARYRGSIVLIEWKTSQRPKPNLADLYETPQLQAVAYLGALRAARQLEQTQMADGALVVVAYAGGSPAHAHYLDEQLCQHYWTLWLQRLHKYYSPKAIE